MLIQRIKLLVCLVFTFIGGIGLFTMFHSNSYKQQYGVKPAQAVQSAATMKEQQVFMADFFQIKLDTLVEANKRIAVKVNSSRVALHKAKHINQTLQQKENLLLAEALRDTDTTAKLVDCDSLETTIADLRESAAQKDSLFEDVQGQLEEQVSNSDSTISVQRQQYNALMLSFDNSLAQQDVLATQNKYLQKQLNRHIVKNKLLSGGLLVLSGITLFSLLHR